MLHWSTSILHKLFQNIEEEKALLNSFAKAAMTLIQKPEKDILDVPTEHYQTESSTIWKGVCTTAKQNVLQELHENSNRIKDKNHRHRKSIWQNLTAFNDENTQQTRNRRGFLQSNRVMYEKPTATIITDETLSTLRLVTRQRCPMSQLLFKIVLEVPAGAVRQEKKIKDIYIRKNKVKLSLLTNNVISNTHKKS